MKLHIGCKCSVVFKHDLIKVSNFAKFHVSFKSLALLQLNPKAKL
jgi:hypothetical protein